MLQACSSCLYLTAGLVSSQDGGLVRGARRVVTTARRGTSSLTYGQLVVPLSNQRACELTGCCRLDERSEEARDYGPTSALYKGGC